MTVDKTYDSTGSEVSWDISVTLLCKVQLTLNWGDLCIPFHSLFPNSIICLLLKIIVVAELIMLQYICISDNGSIPITAIADVV